MNHQYLTRKSVAISALVILSAANSKAEEVGDSGRGLIYARQVCAGCHAVEHGDFFSPDRRATPFMEIAQVPGMTATALTVWLTTTHPNMPNFIVEKSDRLDVIEYLLSLKEEP